MKNSFTEHGNEIEEIITDKLPPIIRWGFVYFIIVLAGLIATCWFIQYPDIINARAKLTSINAPKAIAARQQGKLIRLFAKEKEFVKQGAILGHMESTARHEDVINLKANIDSMQRLLTNNDVQQIVKYQNTMYPNLGELQQSYQVFLQSFQLFANYVTGGFYLRKKSMLLKDLGFMQQLSINLYEQKKLNAEDVKLAGETFSAQQSLNADHVISDIDYRNEASKLIMKRLTLPQINAAIITNQSQQNEKQKEIMELENAISQQKNIFLQALYTLKSHVEEWQQKYLLTAPVDGNVSFATFLQENQQLNANQVICFINPGNTQYYAEIYIPQNNFGKVKKGQVVLLKLPAYPFQEYGSINGKIDFISNLTTDSGYLARVTLPNGLNTSYNKQVQFRDGLSAHGEIITANMRLLQRFYYGIVKQMQ